MSRLRASRKRADPAWVIRLGSSWQVSWLKESSVLVGAQAISVLTSSLLLVLIARTLGPATLGLFAGFLGAAIAANGIVELGMSTWLLRELAATWQDKSGDLDASGRRSELVGVAVSLVVVVTVGVLAAGGFVALAAGFSGQLTLALMALLVYGTLSGIALVLEVGFRALRSVRTPALATILEKIILVVLVGLSLETHADIRILALSYVPGITVRVMFDLKRLRAEQGTLIRAASPSAMWAAARAASPFTLNTLVLVVITRLDVALVAVVSTVAAGYYSVADRSLTALIVFPILSCITLYPHLAGRPERIKHAWKLGVAAAAAVGAVAAGAAAAAPALIPAVFGQRFKPAVHLFQILMISAPALIYSQMMLVSVFTQRRERAAVVSIAVSLLVGTIIFVICLLVWGATGAAVGAVIRSMLFVMSVVILSKRRPAIRGPATLGLPPRRQPFAGRLGSALVLKPRFRESSELTPRGSALITYLLISVAVGAAVGLTSSLAVGAVMIFIMMAALGVAWHLRALGGTRVSEDILGSIGFVLILVAIPLLTSNAVRISHSMSLGDPLLVLGGAVVLARRYRGLLVGSVPAWLPLAAVGVLVAALLAAFRGHVMSDLVPGFEFAGTMIAMPIVVMLALDSARRVEMVVEAWLFVASVSALVGVLDLKFGFGINQRLTGVDYVGFTQRAAGLTLQPNHLALVSAMAMPVAALRASRRLSSQVFAVANARNLFYLFALGTGVLLSGSRAGLAAAVAGLAVLPLFQPGRRRSLGLLAVAGLIVVALGALTFDSSLASKLGIVTGQRFTGQAAGTQISNSYRSQAYAAALHVIVANPFVGQGFQGARTAHDIYLQLLEVGGLIALAAFLAFMAGTIAMARRLAATNDLPWSLVSLASALGASAVVWLVIGLAQNELYDRYLYIPAGLLLAARLMLHEGPAADGSRRAEAAPRLAAKEEVLVPA